MLNKILIAEDDVFISEHLKQILKQLKYDVCGIVSNTQQANDYLTNNPLPDLVLLDIKMHGKDQGIEIAKTLNIQGVPFIYITSFSDKNTIQKAISQHPKGYILKPYTEKEIAETVEKTLSEINSKFLIIKESTAFVKIRIADILFIKSDNMYLEIRTLKKRFVHRLKLSDLLLKLPSIDFIRVHRSYIVNKNYVDKKTSLKIEIKGQEIPISRKYKEVLNNLFSD